MVISLPDTVFAAPPATRRSDKELRSGVYLRESEAPLQEQPKTPADKAAPEAGHEPSEDVAEKRAVYRATLQQVWAMLRKKGCPEGELLDLAQKTYSIAFSKWDSFRGDSRRETWVIGIALNVARDYHRRQKSSRVEEYSEEHHVQDLGREPGRTPEEEAQWRQRWRTLAAAIEQLEPEQRALLELVLLQHLSITDAAKQLGLTQRRGYTVRDAGVARLAEILGRNA